MPAIHILFGTVLLFWGRRLYWLFVAIAGFLVGAQLSAAMLSEQTEIIRVLAAVATGILGALLAMLAQRVGFALAGLYAGGYLALSLAAATGSLDNPLLWFGIGGLIGVILAAALMDWAVIILSSLVGAGAIITALGLSPTVSAAAFIALAAIGIWLQGKRLRPPSNAPTSPS